MGITSTNNTSWIYPNSAPSSGTFYYNYITPPTLEQIREVIREEVHKALHPEEERPSATLECLIEGKLYRGTAYLVEDEDEEEGKE